MLALFSTQVTLVQGRDQLLPREDPDVAAEVADILTSQGVDLRLGVRTTAVHREPGHGDGRWPRAVPRARQPSPDDIPSG